MLPLQPPPPRIQTPRTRFALSLPHLPPGICFALHFFSVFHFSAVFSVLLLFLYNSLA